MYVIESQLILNGNAGQVYSVAPFLPLEDNPLDIYCLVAFCTGQKVNI
jgi:hypothetical protein